MTTSLIEIRWGINFVTLIGRILLSLIFIFAGIGKLMDWESSVQFTASANIPMPELMLGIATALELIGGILILLGWKTRLGVILLLIFLIPTTFLMHKFWESSPENYQVQMSAFMKNLAITGGLLILGAFGPGGWSLDRHHYRKELAAQEAVKSVEK